MSAPTYAILADGRFDIHAAKTAACLIRYHPAQVLVVIDREHAGRSVRDVLGFGGRIPVVATWEEAAALGPDRLLIGISPPGGRLPGEWREAVMAALRAGVDVVSGMHVFLSEDPEMAGAAGAGGARIVDLRRVPDDLSTPTGARDGLEIPVVLTVGSDCNTGKMTAVWEIHARSRDRGLDYGLLPTGQTGILLHGGGIAIDRVVSDFVSGATERYVVEASEGRDLLLVEGQGSLVSPLYSAVTLGQIHGCQPDGMVLCHVSGRERVRHVDRLEIPSLARLVEIYEEAAGWVRPSRVIGVALATHQLEEAAARAALEAARAETGLPSEDPVRFPTGDLLEACEALRRDVG